MRSYPLILGEDALMIANQAGTGQLLRGTAGEVDSLRAGRIEDSATGAYWAHSQ